MVTGLVLNAFPLVCLGKAELLWLLTAPDFRVLIPRPVADEVCAQLNDAGARWLIGLGAGYTAEAQAIDSLLLAWDLGAGETSVISQGILDRDSVVVLDDLAARRCAMASGLRCTGTLGLLLMAKRRRLVPAVMPLVDRLKSAGLYVGDGLVRALRESAGE
jgi:predicted nucleic acid-binding protein